MCNPKSAGSGNVLTTPSGVQYYGDNKAQQAGEAAVGPGHAEETQPPPAEAPPTNLTDCTAFTLAKWDEGCSSNFKFANMKRKPGPLGSSDAGTSSMEEVACNWQKLCQNILDAVKGKFPSMQISSGFRSVAYERQIGASGKGDHTQGKAADIVFNGSSGAVEVFKFIGASNLPYSQLIYEGNWVHVAFGGSSPGAEVMVMRNGKKADNVIAKAKAPAALPPDLRWA